MTVQSVNYQELVTKVLEKCQDLELRQEQHRQLIAEKVLDEMAKGVVMQLAEEEK